MDHGLVQNCLDAMMPQVLTVDFLFLWNMIMVWWAISVNLVLIYLDQINLLKIKLIIFFTNIMTMYNLPKKLYTKIS